jgi:hypothetical protein
MNNSNICVFGNIQTVPWVYLTEADRSAAKEPTMKITYLLLALLLAPPFAASTAAQAPANKTGTRPQISIRPQAYGIEGREIIAPPWSAACMTDHGPSECGQHMWFYGSSDALARYGNAF